MYASRTIRHFFPDNILDYLLVPSPRMIEYSDGILTVFPLQYLLYHPPVPFPDTSIAIEAVVTVCVVLFM